MQMKKTQKVLANTLIGLAAAGSLSVISTDAGARPYHHRGGARVGVYIGAPIIAAPFYRPYYYGPYAYPYYGPAYYPPVVVREQPVVYVEQQQPAPVATLPSQQVPPASSAPSAPQAQQQYWYFCQESQTYYPHAQTCASLWQRVIPHAPQ